VDDRGRPKGWLSERALAGERVLDDLRSSADPIVELDDILRDALSDLLAADTRYGPVVDEAGAVRGILSIEAVGHALAATGSHVPTATELARESAAEDGRRPATAWRALRVRSGALMSGLSLTPVLAQLGDDFFGDREGARSAVPATTSSARAGSWTTSRTT
jgi:CBS domain-containing protein